MWKQAPLSDTATHLNQFFGFVLSGPLIDQLTEYSVTKYPIGPGKFVGTTIITNPTLRHNDSDSAIRHMLQQELSTNPDFPKPNAKLLYFVYLPPGVAVVLGGSRSCQAFCGYHDNVQGQILYAAMPYPNCAGCLGGLNVN
jgi:hypothetical protein